MTQTAFHPGEHIQEELDALGITAIELASRLDVTADALVAVIQGHQSLNAELAMRLGHFFGTSVQSWLNLQVLYDLETAEREYRTEVERLPTLQAA